LPDEELTEVDDDFTVDEDGVLEAAGVDVDAPDDDVFEVDVEALVLVAELDDDEVPGIV
jgi:hypothetical protein